MNQFTLENATVYDLETFPNVFTCHMEMLNSTVASTWEISHFRDDRYQLMQWFNWLASEQAAMIGFNNLGFDYPVIHYIMHNPNATVEQIYEFAMNIIRGNNRFANMVWERDRFAPQIDLFTINHFDNKAKTTSLKALQINMRSPSVVDMPVEVGTLLTEQQVNKLLIPYNKHDVTETKQFAFHCMEAIEFRRSMIDQFGIDVLNWNDSKIGSKILEQKLGDDLCYDRSSGRKEKRQTVRRSIALNEIIFPYIHFNNPEFARVLDWMKTQVLTPEDIEDPEATIKTKGVFSGVKADVGGITFQFGTGGIHGSVTPQRFVATDENPIIDIDVAQLYPNIAIKNGLAPAHLGEPFTREYAELPKERKKWQKLKGKKCVEANAIKLASNGTYGNSNNPFSVFYDPQFTMTITINGQLMLCMLAEWLMTVPTFQIIAINTDGITYRIHRDYLEHARAIYKQWEQFTLLDLEEVNYSRMWIRDVNNYIAESPDGSLKLKGAYWTPDPLDYAASISKSQPPAWHKDLGNVVSIRAAVAAMVRGIDPEAFIRVHSDPFDFMCRAKAPGGSRLTHGGAAVQRTTRYYVAKNGAPLIKVMPPKGEIGQFKRANKLSDSYFNSVMREIGPNVWDQRIHTRNKSKYQMTETAIQAGWNVAICNDASHFQFDNIDHSYYVSEAKKLII